MSFAHVRSILVTAPLVALSTAVMATLSVGTSLFDSSGNAPHLVARAWARILLVIFRAKVTIEGLEKLRPDSSYVFASNHLSYVDTPVISGSDRLLRSSLAMLTRSLPRRIFSMST